MSLSSGEKELLRRLIQKGDYDGSNSDPKLLEKFFVSLAKKGLVKRNFGNPGSGFRRKRRGVRWDGRWELAVSPEEARATLAVDALSESQEPEGDRRIFKGGTMKLSMAIKGYELDPSVNFDAAALSVIGKSVGLHFDAKTQKWIAKP